VREGTVFGGTSSQEAADEAAEARFGYRPALDGLRAVAVLAVIAYHDAYAWARGGFLGVDTFFVLSGFLITTLLVLEERRTATVNLLAFWGRRIRRLLPALLLVLAAVAVYGAVEVPSIELAQLRGDSLSSLFYFANWRFIWTGSSYFAMFSSPSPVRHLWSLAIEEQFYLVWPIVVLVCFSLFRHARRALLVVSLAGTAASTLVMAALYDSSDPSRAYFGTDARIHTILVGAVLAIVLVARPPRATWVRRTVQGIGAAAAVGVLWAMHSLSDLSSAYYHGGSLVFAVGVAAVIAAVVQPAPGALRAGLALAPLVWVGRISYGLYLWHWPVNVYLTETRMGFGGSALNILRLAVTFGFATVSFYLVEMPIRRGGLRTKPARWLAPVAVAGTGVALVVATAGASTPPSYLGGGGGLPAPRRIVNIDDSTGAAAAEGESSPGVNFRTGGAVAHLGIVECPPPRADEKQRAAAAVASRGAPPPVPPGGRVRVLVVGDSLGCSIAIGLGPAGAPALEVRQATIVGCGVVSDQVFDEKEPFPRGTENCAYYAPTVEAEAMAEFRPDLVLWISTWERFPLVVGDRLLRTGTPAWSRELQHRLEKGYRRLTKDGARLAFVTVAPPAPASMLDGGRIVSPEFDYRFPAMNAELLRFVATHPDTRLIDVATKVCPHGAPCPTSVGHAEPRHGDGVHFQPQGAVWLTRWMLPQLLAALPPRGAGPTGAAPVATRP
jgi:peptidoglycan/LPS O-acetylase OafA/YrhL